MASRASKSALSQDQTRELLFTESGNESDGNDNNCSDEFIVNEKEYSSTSDEDTSLGADNSVLGKLIYYSMKIYTLSLIKSIQSIFFVSHLKTISLIMLCLISKWSKYLTDRLDINYLFLFYR